MSAPDRLAPTSTNPLHRGGHPHMSAPDRLTLMQRIKEIAETRVRYGYRRIHVLLRREGWHVQSECVGSIERWGCNYGTNHPNDGSSEAPRRSPGGKGTERGLGHGLPA